MDKERIFNEFDFMSKKYANKVFAYENLGFEYEDLVQEFRIKLWTSIQAYEKRLDAYEKGLASKPVPIKFYLECACANKVRDFIKEISEESYKMSIEDIDFDYGVLNESEINPSTNRFILNGVDLLDGLDASERAVFALFLKGYQKKILRKVNCNADKIIKNQKSRLQKSVDLMKSFEIYVSYNFDED